MSHKIKILLIFMFFLGIVISLYNILNWIVYNNENNSIEKELKDIIIKKDTNINDELFEIDFKSLKEKNSDTVAYLKVNNTKIDYVVVKAKDNKYYLSHNFNKKSNSAGWVFADYHNNFDNEDKNIVIYGHNMKNGSMFGTLKYVLKKNWYNNKNNHKILFVDENGNHTYQVFSTYIIDVEDYYINTIFRNNDEFLTFIKKLKKRSKYNYNIELESTDRILTLSTCSSGGSKRVVLHAKLINE